MSGRVPLAMFEAARQQAGCTVVELWVEYFALGGVSSLAEVQAVLGGNAQLERRDHDRLAQALNDRFVVMDLDHPVSYFDELAR